ncbi:MAG: hypothetical protein H0V53_11135 [Rubrobacter sp.]|nr:hypothetical protein [Rubrobacter sp.]
MKLLRGVYEGPGSHGILRVSASLARVQAVLRASPEEGYFPALLGSRTKRMDPEPAPVSLSPIWDRGSLSGSSWAPGNLSQDLANTVRRHPEAETVVLARSETALLSGEELPELSIPGGEEEPPPKLVTFGWESPGLRETEAADLALAELVRAYAAPAERTEEPTVNIFGPPVFNPGAAAEVAEVERLLGLLGVGVNARVPLGARARDLEGLPRAWANVLLYREVGDGATLYLKSEFGTPRVTTPMVGAAGTGAVLRAVGELCSLDAQRVRRLVWSELADTARLPWYARLASPESIGGRRVAIFGDFTYAIGLGYTMAREVGLEVGPCGTYMEHLERDFLFHANTFTDDAFVTDDPEKVASRIESASPDLVVGTHLEREVAASLGVPFLPLLSPAASLPFVERPLMGYAGSGVLADALEDALRGVPREKSRETGDSGVPWTEGALEELEGVSAFLRGRSRRLAEQRAEELGSTEVTRRIFRESRS